MTKLTESIVKIESLKREIDIKEKEIQELCSEVQGLKHELETILKGIGK